jgi:hypothetical protein
MSHVENIKYVLKNTFSGVWLRKKYERSENCTGTTWSAHHCNTIVLFITLSIILAAVWKSIQRGFTCVPHYSAVWNIILCYFCRKHRTLTFAEIDTKKCLCFWSILQIKWAFILRRNCSWSNGRSLGVRLRCSNELFVIDQMGVH